jgi:hypothetical protein
MMMMMMMMMSDPQSMNTISTASSRGRHTGFQLEHACSKLVRVRCHWQQSLL